MIYSIYVHFEIFHCSQGSGTGIGVVFSTPGKKKIVNGNASAESLPPPPKAKQTVANVASSKATGGDV